MPSILISGANRGLGLEFARQYASDGWDVIATAREPEKADALKAIAKEVLPLDVADGGSVAALATRLRSRPLDLVISNAGIYGPRGQAQTLNGMDYDGWAETFAANTMGPFRLAAALLPNLRMARKTGATAKLIFITSKMGSIAEFSGGDNYIYCSSKAALNLVGHGLAQELKPDGITVLLMHPGWVQTDMGGAQAPLKPQDSIAGMRKVIAKAGVSDSGRYLTYDDKELPW